MSELIMLTGQSPVFLGMLYRILFCKTCNVTGFAIEYSQVAMEKD